MKIEIKDQTHLIEHIKTLSPLKIKRLKEWVAALKSGKYIQGKGYLRSGDNKYCCLGVACDISKKTTGLTWRNSYEIDGSAYLREETAKHFGFNENAFGFNFVPIGSNRITETLVTLNDDYDWTFEQIGNLVQGVIDEAKTRLKKKQKVSKKKK